ncbi:unnamed protein product [Ectocarpus fasciculatus]
MWRPDEVVPQHKRRAVALWTILIGGIIFYSSYLLYKAVRKRENPDSSIELSNTVFEYPDIWVCLYAGYGCDEWELEEECMTSATANMTGWGNSSAVFYPGGDYEQEIPVEGKLTPDVSEVTFTVVCTRYHIPWTNFQGPIAWQETRWLRRKWRHWNDLVETFP